MTEYHNGTHPLFAIAKVLRRWRERTAVISVFVRLLAYFKLWIFHVPRDASDELVAYLRQEQLVLSCIS